MNWYYNEAGKKVKKTAATGLKRMVALSSVALVLPSSIAVGFIIGYFLDRWLKTEPWMLLSWTVLGVISGLLNLYREITRFLKEIEEDSENLTQNVDSGHPEG